MTRASRPQASVGWRGALESFCPPPASDVCAAGHASTLIIPAKSLFLASRSSPWVVEEPDAACRSGACTILLGGTSEGHDRPPSGRQIQRQYDPGQDENANGACSAVPVLMPALQDQVREVRCQTVFVLGQIGPETKKEPEPKAHAGIHRP